MLIHWKGETRKWILQFSLLIIAMFESCSDITEVLPWPTENDKNLRCFPMPRFRCLILALWIATDILSELIILGTSCISSACNKQTPRKERFYICVCLHSCFFFNVFLKKLVRSKRELKIKRGTSLAQVCLLVYKNQHFHL